MNTRKLMNSILLFQYVPRILRIYLSWRELMRSARKFAKTPVWLKGLFNFFLYILASHVSLIKFWFFFFFFKRKSYDFIETQEIITSCDLSLRHAFSSQFLQPMHVQTKCLSRKMVCISLCLIYENLLMCNYFLII